MPGPIKFEVVVRVETWVLQLGRRVPHAIREVVIKEVPNEATAAVHADVVMETALKQAKKKGTA